MQDLLFQTKEGRFSYRVAGICMQNGSVLLQRPENDSGFAFPGGHAAFGESNEETLVREFYEEIGAEIAVGELKAVGEIFFPWGEALCHQICMFYKVAITSEETPKTGKFPAKEQLEEQAIPLDFYWIPLEQLSEIELCPPALLPLLQGKVSGIEHFVYREPQESGTGGGRKSQA